ncbi:DUF6036 family nucleotidyltransferase [Cytophaga hutchinsonii]|uniref:DUF6036 domain-containing protein n=1 Tax=Cytophaga hutchinsonii (strain ATCC 33406 / DSM 1761 / CIP 103989 / NBRC 15051 / NCIMB 9469 / D465) TaxID=269798 RepID=A0A6N4SPV4_CYTH3|nr:DUF6036 family nucleotidyltransferase [Cytophaga hutchinsonii]ABG58294.1 hypothetical protein CHU_1017 [Cytophaga hutchinsonii ATCC 33406]SFX53178.1 hypothetical protein SAMN04487930_105136 [Cytophaga hutchinsonii ATCC 33406]
MDILDEGILNLWKNLHDYNVKYIMVGGFATNLHGFSRTTDDCDIWIEDTPANRNNLRTALEKNEGLDFSAVERMEFVPGWSSIQLQSGLSLDIMTYLKGFPQEAFENCYNQASEALLYDLTIRFLQLNHLIEAKKQTGRPKDLIDVIELEKIQKGNV